MAHRLQWARDGHDWPHRERSHFVDAADVCWHLQRWEPPFTGAPWVVLVHGTGAATHSWRGLAPLLAQRAGVIAVDLPGHGFSSAAAPEAASMVAIARALRVLLRQQAVDASVLVGHSAGAAIAVQMALDEPATHPALVSINGALMPLAGVAGALATPLTRLLGRQPLAPLVPRLFAWSTSSSVVLQGLLASTGSVIDADGRRLYGRLLASPAHVAGALAMMAQWDLPALASTLPRLQPPLHLLAGSRDRTVSPQQAAQLAALLPGAVLHRLDGLGHLAHEEAPAAVASLIIPILSAVPPTAVGPRDTACQRSPA